MKKKIIVFGILIAVLAAGSAWIFYGNLAGRDARPQTNTHPAAGVLVGNRLPQFTLNALAGKEIRVGAPGKATVLNFWATWCPPCRAEMPELEEFSRKYGTQVNFYAINIQEPAEKITEFMQQRNFSMPVLIDKDGETARTFRINAIPTTVIADKQGVIRYRKSGTVTISELEGILKGL
jgi:thiol-disulfide isomerase/thioredoxin